MRYITGVRISDVTDKGCGRSRGDAIGLGEAAEATRRGSKGATRSSSKKEGDAHTPYGLLRLEDDEADTEEAID